MRTTVDLPPAVYQRARELAQQRGTSLSHVIADLTERGLEAASASAPAHEEGDPTPDPIDGPMNQPTRPIHRIDPLTGFPVISLGRPVTREEVTEFLRELDA